MMANCGTRSLAALTKMDSLFQRIKSMDGSGGGQSCFVADKSRKDTSIRFTSSCAVKKKDLMDPMCKIAIITGGATGIGYAAAFQLLCEGAAHVIIGGRRSDVGEEAVKKLNDRFGKGKAKFIKADVNSHCEFENLFKEAINSYEQVDILFNNAGMLDDKHWELTVDTNIKGVLRGCFLAFQYMGKDCGGHGGLVVNNASIVGFQELPFAPVYCCSKHAVVGITKCLGDKVHYSRNGIRICSLCPGVTTTDLVTNAHGRQLTEEWSKETQKMLDSLPKQTIDATGKAFLYVVRNGETANHYIIEDSKVLHAKVPDRKAFSCVLANYK